MNTFSAENQLVLFACSANPEIDALQQTITNIDDWATACDKLIKKGVAPLFLELLEKNPELVEGDEKQEEESGEMADGRKRVPREVVAKLKQAYLKTFSRSVLLYDTFREIAEGLNAKGIKAVALKGVYLAEHLYPKIGLRQFSDIDLLFRKEDVEAALEVFGALGFVLEKQAFSENVSQIHESAHLPHLMRRGVSVELHTRLHGPFNEYDLPEMELFDRAVPVTINSQAFHVFELHDLFLHLCIHLDKHVNSTHVQFYSFADIGRILTKHAMELNWDTLMRRSKAYGCEKALINQLSICKDLFNAPLPTEINEGLTDWRDPALVNRLIDHLDNKIVNTPATQTHIKYIKRIKQPYQKFLYLIEIIFPSKRILIRAYKIRHQKFFWLWYPYRWWIGFKGLVLNRELRDS